LPRQDGVPNGNITTYNVYVSTDGVVFTKIATGNWTDDASLKTVSFTPTAASYIQLEATAGHGGYASASEINIDFTN
jgi:hypothetical protein